MEDSDGCCRSGAGHIFLGLITAAAYIEARSNRPIEQMLRTSIAKRRWKRDLSGGNKLNSIDDIKHGRSEDFAPIEGWEYAKWVSTLAFNANGDFVRTIECMPLNVADEPRGEIEFPIFSDDPPTRPWAKEGRKALDIRLNWDSERGVGIYTVPLSKALPPGQMTRIRYGYTLEDVARVGSDYWEKLVMAPLDLYKVKLSAEKPWVITAPRASVLTADRQPVTGLVPDLTVRQGKVYWTVPRPRQGTRLRLDWNTVNSETLTT